MMKVIGALAIFLLLSFQVSAEQSVKRIIALAPHSVEMLYTLGAGDLLVGTTEYGDYPEAAKLLPRVGGYHGLQIEKILALEPDLIIAWESGNKKKDLDQLAQLGLNLFRSRTERIEDIPEELIEIGKIIGRETAARAAADAFNERFAQIREQNQHKKKLPFFYQLWSAPLKTLTGGSWINPVIESCGGENIFPRNGDMHYPQVSIENVLLKRPEVIIVPSHHGAEVASEEYWENWPEIPAVKNNHVFYINGDILHRFTVRILDGMQQVCEAFDQVRASQSS